ncbi:MAG: DUF4433 domain-containing protein [Candidatus Syntrophoarchaeum sp.]|nr:DUF4433 domain-containing protein [Candidatus Syntrophoarchaeum sp.]
MGVNGKNLQKKLSKCKYYNETDLVTSTGNPLFECLKREAKFACGASICRSCGYFTPDLTFLGERYELLELYHMTHINNVASIIEKGILCRNEINKKALQYEDISNMEVQERREDKIIDNIDLHSYVPLFFAKRTPMQYALKLGGVDWQAPICFLCINVEVLLIDGTYFTDGNAASNRTKFYDDLSELDKLPWDILRADYWIKYEDGKRKRSAEVLVPHKIPFSMVHRVVVYNRKALINIIGTVPRDVEIAIDRRFYFSRIEGRE